MRSWGAREESSTSPGVRLVQPRSNNFLNVISGKWKLNLLGRKILIACVSLKDNK